MSKIILKTNEPGKTASILFEALEIEEKRLQYSLGLAKYNVSSDKFIAEWSAEDLKGQDMEYIEWSGEYQLALRLNERLFTLKSIENVT